MATLEQKRACEARVRALLRDGGLPEPDAVEFGNTCIWVFYEDAKTCLRVDIDEDPLYDYDADEYRDAEA